MVVFFFNCVFMIFAIFQQQILEDLTIQSVTSSSNSDKSLRRSSRHRTVVVETSTDSE